MSESVTQIAVLEARVAELESQLAVFVERAKDDDEQIRSLAQRVNEYGARYDEAVAAVDQRVADALAQFGARLYEAFAKDVAKDAVTQVASFRFVRFERLRVRNSRKPQNMLARQVRFGFCG